MMRPCEKILQIGDGKSKNSSTICHCVFGNSRAGGFIYMGINAIWMIKPSCVIIILNVSKIKIEFTKRHDKTYRYCQMMHCFFDKNRF